MQRLEEHAQRRLQPDWYRSDSRTPPRPTASSKALEEPFDATNDAEAMLGRVDYQMPAGSRMAVRYSFSNNEAKNANATGNALSDTTISAVSNNGTESDRTNTVVGEYTSALSLEPAAGIPRAVFARAASARGQRAACRC